MASGFKKVLRHIWAWRTIIILFLAPILLLPLPLVMQTKETDCAYVVMLMAVYWITESLPIAVTSLLPVVLFPFLEIMSSADVAKEYLNDTSMLFIGGLVMAIAIEYWNIHTRVAMRIMMFVGTEPKWLLLGMMTATWFLSIWISNIATTAMMLPISEAIMEQLKGGQSRKKQGGAIMELQVISPANGTQHAPDRTDSKASLDKDRSEAHDQAQLKVTADVETAEQNLEDDPAYKRFCKAMSLSICYSSNAGGIASLTGTGPNLVLKGQADKLYQEHGLVDPVTFGTWIGYGFPLSILVMLIGWLWLLITYLRCGCSKPEDHKERSKRISESIREEYRKLGPLVAGQVMVSVLFIILLVLWITRDLGGVSGWGKSFKPEVNDGASSILICILLFALPSTLPCLKSYSNPSHPSKWGKGGTGTSDKNIVMVGPLEIKPLINWRVVHEKMPWHLFLLLGGGYSMSEGCKVSGLSAWIGKQLQFFVDWDKLAVLFLVCYITTAATEIMSNVAVANLFLPILSKLAGSTGVHPLYYMFPCTLASSFAFMLPVSTAPNAIVFAYGRLRVIDMAVTGLAMNIIAVPILVGITITVGNAIFDFDNVPPEFLNSTLLQKV